MEKKKNKSINKKYSIILVTILLIIVTISFFKFTSKVDEYTFESKELYQYFAEEKTEYEGKLTINKSFNKITKINFKDIHIELDSTPIYFKGEHKALFPETMSVIKVKERKQFKINYFSTIKKDIDYCLLEDGNGKSNLKDAIIYNGKDLYFFTDKVNVIFGDKNIELSPLSYIIVNNVDRTVDIYNEEKDEYKIYEENDNEVIIQKGDYKLSATYDILNYKDNSVLLVKDIEKLKHLS